MRKADRKDVLKNRRVIQSLIFLSVIFVFLGIVLWRNTSRGSTAYVERDDFIFGTLVRVVVASEKQDPETIIDAMIQEMKRIESKFHPYHNGSSVIFKLNHSSKAMTVDEETAFLISKSLYYSKLTAGAFDPALGRLIKLWGFDSPDTEKKLPKPEEIQEALKASGYRNVKVNVKEVLLENGVWLDLGGIAKGYAVDQAVRIAKRMDENATGFVDAGGDIAIIGPKFGQYPWKIGIRDPRGGPQDIVGVVYLSEGAIATSGDYERYFEVEGIRYHHILDPQTGYPARKAISATVIAKKLVDADALATAAFVLGWHKIVEGFVGIGAQAMIIDAEGNTFKTRGFSAYEKE